MYNTQVIANNIKIYDELFFNAIPRYIEEHATIRSFTFDENGRAQYRTGPIQLFDYQVRYMRHLSENKRTIAPKFRQGGFSTINVLYSIARCMRSEKERILMVTGRDRAARELSFIAQTAIENSDVIKSKISHQNDYRIEFTNGARITFAPTMATVGHQCSFLFVDEAAFIQDMNTHWLAMYPALATGASCCLVSSVNGNNWFGQRLTEARNRENDFSLFEAHYAERPDFANPAWAEKVKVNLGDNLFRQEMLCEIL